MNSFLVRDSEQDMQGQISHVCTAKASLDGTILWVFLDIIDTEPSDASKKKYAMALLAALELPNVTIRKITMDEHIRWLCETVSKSSYKLPLLAHSMDRDIDFMYKSSSFFNGDPLKVPGNQRTSWQKITKICTQRLLTSCPITFRAANPEGKWGSATLDTFVTKLLGRAQQHNAVSDVVDLVEVLKIAWALDQFKLPKENFLIVKPCNSLSPQPEQASTCHPLTT